MTQEPSDPAPSTSRRFPLWVTSWVKTALTMLVGAAVVVLLALPLRPDPSEGFEELGWFLLVLGGVVLVAVLVGATMTYVTLYDGQDPHPIATALVLVPSALVLGAVSAGVAALLAPGVAYWLVSGFSTRRTADGRPGPRGWPSRGRPQQAVLGVVVVLLFVVVVLGP